MQVGRRNFRRSVRHVLLHRLHIVHVRLAPLAEMESVIYKIFPVRILSVLYPGLRRAVKTESEPSGHHAVILLEHGCVSGRAVDLPRDYDACVSPSRGSLQHI